MSSNWTELPAIPVSPVFGMYFIDNFFVSSLAIFYSA